MPEHTLADLKPDPNNARRHNPKNVGMIERALSEVGTGRSIVVDENGTVLAGNATIEAAAQAGINRVRFVDSDGETLIAVRRSGLTDEQKQRLALFDNRAAELADWDADVLAALVDENETALAGMFTDYELAMVMEQESPEFNAEDEWQGMPEYENEKTTSKYQVIVHFDSDEAIEEFERLVDQKIPERRAKAFGIWFPKREPLALNGLRYSSDEA